MWAGVECTLNRVGDGYVDQVDLTGHYGRLSDLDLLGGLGVRAVRYPVRWEQVAREGWAWADERLTRLRELGLRPVVGLVHHGSGPPSTSLVDDTFASGLAAFARDVAARYPWVDAYTPVNEPLTTARFSCLYGHWYPHLRDGRAFARALLNQCRATVLATRAIREVRPDAQLVQTEDLAKTHSTPRLRYQADFENERRFATFDLLCGRPLGRDNPFGSWLRHVGVEEDELRWFEENACPPDVLGLNHYLTGERFLDERVERYPEDERGGNGRHEYADVSAVRVLGRGPDGPKALLREVWERYGLPLAVTEVQNGCTREEQLRWLDDVWRGAVELREEGVDVRAVTVWAAFGAFGWSDLATCGDGLYETGMFDVRAPAPRPTAVAGMAADLAGRGRHHHPVLESPGWWRRLDRLLYPPVGGQAAAAPPDSARPLLIAGARGTLGRAFARLCRERGLEHRLLARPELDVADARSVARAFREHRPWAVVNCAGYIRVDDAELEEEACRRANADGAAVVAAAAADAGAALVTFSSDLVFDGEADQPYVESDPVAPLNVYGQTKAEAERRVLEAHQDALVIRTSAFFGPWDEHNFVTIALRELAAGRPFAAADDVTVSPTYVPDLVQASLDLLIDGERGVWHLANEGAVTWAELAAAAAAAAGVEAAALEPCPLAALTPIARRARWSVLGSERGWPMPPLENALARYAAATRVAVRV